MSRVEVTCLAAAPVERVWNVFIDLAARDTVMSGVDRVEVLTAGPFDVGTLWRETRTLRGEPVTEELRVVECEPARRCVLDSAGTGADYRMTYDFLPHPHGTAVRALFDAQPRGLTGKVLAAVLGGLATAVAEGALRQDLADLARASEHSVA